MPLSTTTAAAVEASKEEGQQETFDSERTSYKNNKRVYAMISDSSNNQAVAAVTTMDVADGSAVAAKGKVEDEKDDMDTHHHTISSADDDNTYSEDDNDKYDEEDEDKNGRKDNNQEDEEEDEEYYYESDYEYNEDDDDEENKNNNKEKQFYKTTGLDEYIELIKNDNKKRLEKEEEEKTKKLKLQEEEEGASDDDDQPTKSMPPTVAAVAAAAATIGSASTPRKNKKYFGIGCLCIYCKEENHMPVQDCDRIKEWIQYRTSIMQTTYKPLFVDIIAKYFICNVSIQFNISIEEAGICCRRYNWNLLDIYNSDIVATYRHERQQREVQNRNQNEQVVQLALEFDQQDQQATYNAMNEFNKNITKNNDKTNGNINNVVELQEQKPDQQEQEQNKKAKESQDNSKNDDTDNSIDNYHRQLQQDHSAKIRILFQQQEQVLQEHQQMRMREQQQQQQQNNNTKLASLPTTTTTTTRKELSKPQPWKWYYAHNPSNPGWRNYENDHLERRKMLDDIVIYTLKMRKPNDAKLAHTFLRNVLSMTQRLEHQLYSTATSLDMYTDRSTMPQRLQDVEPLIAHLLQDNNQQEETFRNNHHHEVKVHVPTPTAAAASSSSSNADDTAVAAVVNEHETFATSTQQNNGNNSQHTYNVSTTRHQGLIVDNSVIQDEDLNKKPPARRSSDERYNNYYDTRKNSGVTVATVNTAAAELSTGEMAKVSPPSTVNHATTAETAVSVGQQGKSDNSSTPVASSKIKDTLTTIGNKQEDEATANDTSCKICYEDDIPADQMMSMECGHTFCLDCWSGVMQINLREGDMRTALQGTCPENDCQQIITEVHIQKVAPNLLSKFYDWQVQSFLQANNNIGTLRWCPGANCGWVAIKSRNNLFEDTSNSFSCQNCGTNFCFRCGNTPHDGDCHPPEPIQQQQQEEEEEQQQAEQHQANTNTNENQDFAEGVEQQQRQQQTQAAVGRGPRAAVGRRRLAQDNALNTNINSEKEEKVIKKCPKCTVDIQKIGGCHRMRCKCGHAFCWLCLADMPDYNHYCGREGGGVQQQIQRQVPRDIQNPTTNLDYVRQSLTDPGYADFVPDGPDAEQMLTSLDKLDRYAHYYNRYYAHSQGQRFAETQCPCLEQRMSTYTNIAGIKCGGEIDFIRSANETLVASRRLLKYAYCSAYYKPQNCWKEDASNADALHFERLEQLERFTEELSEISESAISRQDRRRSLELVGAITRTMGALEDFEN